MSGLDGLSPRDIRALLKQGDFARLVKDHLAQVRAENQRRRALVLQYPDLAARLCKPPLREATPETWNGWIPPEIWREQINDSPIRAALVALVAEAERRNTAARRAA